MIRLIDKMQLVDAVLKKRYSQASINLILNQPEIEAIPIEWIKQYANRGSDFFLYAEEEPAVIREMLEEWEKENEV